MEHRYCAVAFLQTLCDLLVQFIAVSRDTTLKLSDGVLWFDIEVQMHLFETSRLFPQKWRVGVRVRLLEEALPAIRCFPS